MFWPIALGATLLVSACSQPTGPGGFKSSYDAEAVIERGEENQPILSIRKAKDGTQADLALFELQGYVEAQDRFFQMDLIRRSATGRMGELFGERARSSDYKQIGAGLRMAAERNTARIQRDFPEMWPHLEAFAKGVNRYLGQMDWRNPELLKRYCSIVSGRSETCSYRPMPWTPFDTIAVTLSVSFYLSSSLEEKLVMGGIAARFFDDQPSFFKLLDLRPLYDTFIMDAADRKAEPWKAMPLVPPPASAPLVLDTGCLDAGFPFQPCHKNGSLGSNNWAVDKTFSGDGAGYLSNDPHLPLTMPTTLYELSLDSKAAGGRFHVRGFNLAGVLGILIGQNGDIAWAFTNMPADVDDVYIELIDPKRSMVMHGPMRWKPLQKIPYEYQMRGRDGTVTTEKKMLSIVPHHGPVFNELILDRPQLQKGLRELAEKEIPVPHLPTKVKVRQLGVPSLAYRWTGHEGTAELPGMFYAAQAKSYAAFNSALKGRFQAGIQNMVVLEKDGTIGYVANGKYPTRPYATATWPPFIPQMGFTGKQEWGPYRTEVPQFYNPRSGRIVTANNDVWGHSKERSLSGFRDYFGYGFATGARAERITQLLEANRGKISVDVIRRIQKDHTDLTILKYRSLLDRFGDSLEFPMGREREGKAMVERLRNFNGVMNRDETDPVAAYYWLNSIAKAYWTRNPTRKAFYLPEIGYGLMLICKTAYNKLNDALEAEKMLAGRVAVGGFAAGAATILSAADARAILADSIVRTVDRLREDKRETTRWGEMWKLEFFNPFATFFPQVAVFPLERNGSWESIDVAGPGYGPNFRAVHVAKNGKIESFVNMAGGNYEPSDTRNWARELHRWNDGEVRDLVPFPQP